MLKTFFLTVAVIGSFLASSYAAADLSPTEQIEMVTTHNKWRSTVPTPAVSWSNRLADNAQAWANTLKNQQACRPVHSRAADLGENIFWGGALMYSDGNTEQQIITPEAVVDDWASENNDYNYSSNTCAAGKSCGHYTQIIWANTTEIGCGKAVCADNSQVWVCNYAPPGNYIGKRPY